MQHEHFLVTVLSLSAMQSTKIESKSYPKASGSVVPQPWARIIFQLEFYLQWTVASQEETLTDSLLI